MLDPHVFALVALLGLATYALSLLALHLLPTGYNPLRDAVSLYAVGRFGLLHRVQSIASAVCAFGLVGALVALRAPLPWLGLAALGVLGIARVLIVTVPAHAGDKGRPRDAPLPRRVALHLLLAAVIFVVIALAAGVLTAPIAAWHGWRGPAPLLAVVGILTPASVVAFFVAIGRARTHPYLGLFQRAVYALMICWQALVLAPLLR